MTSEAEDSTSTDPQLSGLLRRSWNRIRRIHWQIYAAFGIVCLLLYVQTHPLTEPAIETAAREAGYPGLFLAAIISGFNLVVPVPVVTLFPTLVESGMVPIIALLVIVVGMTTGDLIGALLGRLGRQGTRRPQGKVAQWFETTMKERPNRALIGIAIYAAFVPAPNEIVVIPSAYFGMGIFRMILALLCGNLVFNSLVASGLLAFAS